MSDQIFMYKTMDYAIPLVFIEFIAFEFVCAKQK